VSTVLRIDGLGKEFVLHQQGGASIDVLDDVSLEVAEGEAVAITGPSGRGKSSLLKLIYGTYSVTRGSIRVWQDGEWLNVATAAPRDIVEMRRRTAGYVTQFLRVIPRIPAIDIVAEPLIERGVATKRARERASNLLDRLNIPEKLWPLSPMTFSGGEQQRVNIARGFAVHHRLLLLDEPTASLDRANRDRVLALVKEARTAGSAVVAVFHDAEERRRVCDREVALKPR
jgi:alpha-D-ribose 1-methylphosphonate 5-triphosphate synthase subunit PhnL